MRFTAADLSAATEVRTAYGWLEVVRVNDDSTVTVVGDFDLYRIPQKTILEVRT